jgi:carbonic anhydrase
LSTIDKLLANADAYAERFDKGHLPRKPAKGVAIVACMDARIDLFSILGLEAGDANFIRNAGGAITDDTIRSLVISQRLLGTREIMLIHHTNCGMLTFNADEFRRELEAETGMRPPWAVETFSDPEQDVRQSIARVRSNPFLIHTDAVRGFVYEVETGRLVEVT